MLQGFLLCGCAASKLASPSCCEPTPCLFEEVFLANGRGRESTFSSGFPGTGLRFGRQRDGDQYS